MDIQVPKTGGRKPLVVFLSGGGFVVSDQASSLDQRTYVADHGYVVASVQYRTTLDGATYKDGVADVKSAIRYLRARRRVPHQPGQGGGIGRVRRRLPRRDDRHHQRPQAVRHRR
jgi:acetyl esterase/lipase